MTMPTNNTSPLFRLFPSLTDVAFLAPILLLFVRLDGVKTMLGDGDTGWHIRAGEWMLANGRVPETDLFSYTKSGEPWYAWEWLSDIVLALAHQWFGLAGPVVLGILLLCLTSALLFRLCRRHTNNDLIAIGVTTIAVAASSIHWLARPHLFTFLFLVISLDWLDRSYTNRRVLWYFPPLVALWTNLHGAFFVSIVLLLTVGIGLMLRELLAPAAPGWKAAWVESRMYFFVAAACGAASLVNPYGWNLHIHIVRYLTERYHFDHIIEFQTLSFHAPVAMFFEALLVAGLLAAGWAVLQRRFADALLLVSWLHLALIAGRNIPIYAILAAPLVTRFLSEVLTALRTAPVAAWAARAAAATEEFSDGFTRVDRIPRLHPTSAAAVCLLLLAVAGAPADATKLRAEFDPKKYPAGALTLLEGKRVFTNDEWGDYLIYKLYPHSKVFVDGRSDFYGGEFSLRYLDVMAGKWDWESILAQHRVDAVLLPADAALSSTLKASPTWRPVYDDQTSILFVASGNGQPPSPGDKTSPAVLSEVTPGRQAEAAIASAEKPNSQLQPAKAAWNRPRR